MQNNVKFYRKKKGLTQVELAERVGTTQQHIFRIEKGTRNLTLEKAKEIANILECSAADLMPEEFHPSPTLTTEEQMLLDYFRGMTDENKQAMLAVGTTLSQPTVKKDVG